MADLYSADVAGVPTPLSSASIRIDGSAIVIDAVSPVGAGTNIASAVGQTLTIWRNGARFVSAPVDRLRYDRGAKRASVSLSARSDHTATGTATVALHGVSYRSLSGGIRRYRCAVPQALEIGDTATASGEQIVVAEIVYTLGNHLAVAEVSE